MTRLESREVSKDIAYVKACAIDTQYLLGVAKWQEAIDKAQVAINTLEGLQLYAGEQRNKAFEDYCKAHPGYIPF
ncbi:MAG: hypothetical protein LBK83_15770 [Treponema sp.]|jgi:hypothetical protein|nr:hypothetical protein [Treponema sp.]